MPRLKNEYLNLNKEKNGTDLNKIKNLNIPIKSEKIFKSSTGVIIDGMKNCSVKFSKCCNPFPGDKIIGFITKGYGVSIHKVSCENVKKSRDNNELTKRLVSAKWSDGLDIDFETNIEVVAHYSDEFLTNLTRKISALSVPLISLNSKILSNNKISAMITMTIKNQNNLKFVIDNLLRIEGIISVRRM